MLRNNTIHPPAAGRLETCGAQPVLSKKQRCAWAPLFPRFEGEFRLPVFERHVFVCHNVRPAEAPRPCCSSDGKSELHACLNQLTKDAGLGGRVRINKSGCLDQCEHGATMVVYPEAVWYGAVKPEDAEEIVREHLVGGRPVERLRIAETCLNAKICPHRG